MTEDEERTPGAVPGLAQEAMALLRGVAEGLTRFTQHLPSAPGALPLPGTISAAQLKSISDAIAAQRRSIEALKGQLSAFDQQLAVLEQILDPLAQWSGKWAELEERLLSAHRSPKGEAHPDED
jgi:hypothetical protein